MRRASLVLLALCACAHMPPCPAEGGPEWLEITSPHFEALLEAERERLQCDAVVVSDTGMLAADVPSTCIGMRGLVAFDVGLRTAAADLHSGVFGGAAPNSAHLVARIVAALHHDDGRVAIPGFYDEVRPLSDAEERSIAAVPFDEADWMRTAGVRRVVLAGSTAVYGDAAELPNRETTLPQPLSPYAASKLAAEAYCQAFHASYGLETVVLRYFNVFGPRQDPDSPYAAVVPRFILAALRREPPLIFGDGEQTRDFTYVANVVRANALACTAPRDSVAGQVYNIGCGASVTINELWDRIQQALDITLPARHGPARAGEVRDSRAGIERATRQLGYRPGVDFATGLRLTVEAYAQRWGAEAPLTSRARVIAGRRPSLRPQDAA